MGEHSLNTGITLYKNRKYQESYDFFSAADFSSSDDPIEIIYYLGLCSARLQKHEEALLYLEQVVTSGENDNIDRLNQCRLALAVIYSQTGRLSMADFELKKLLEGGYRTSAVFCAMAYAAWMNGSHDVSVSYYEKALEMDDSNPTALNGLGYVLASSGRDLTRALSLCKKAVDYEPDSGAYLDSLGWVYYQLGLDKEARMYIARAREKNPAAEEIQEHYKKVYSHTGAVREHSSAPVRGRKK